MKWLEKISSIASEYFALWVVVASMIGLIWPSTFLFLLPHIRIVLGVIMFGMGMTLSLAEFKHVAALFLSILQIALVPVVLGVVAQRYFEKTVAKRGSRSCRSFPSPRS